MASEDQLSAVLSEFARTMVTNFPIQGILDHLVRRIVGVLPITAAGVTLISPGGKPRYVAASDSSAFRFERLQADCGEGPCVKASETGEAVSIPELRMDGRFPNFGPRAISAGLEAVFTFPLRSGDASLGALDLYRDSPGPLDAAAMDAAQTLADVAAAYLINAQAREDLQEAADRSREGALHDPLTGLPNRVLLFERLDHAILRGRRSGTSAAVLFADLDNFKRVNDTHGHAVGDELLVAVARRMTGHLRPGDTLARLSGDEFVILCEDIASPADAEVMAARVGELFTMPFVVSCGEVKIAASLGVTFAGRADHLPEEVLHIADLAMYKAKSEGGARHYLANSGDLSGGPMGTHRELQRAISAGELRVSYQPIRSCGEGRISGAEALLRWAHPTRGLLPPSAIIPIAEQSGTINEIGLWVLRRACEDRRSWRGAGGVEPLGISVNVSPYQLLSSDFVAGVREVLATTETDPTLLTLEITESVLIDDSERAIVVLEELKSVGVTLALDDFGTGYSSLSYLKQFPIDVVKIDRAFITDLPHDRDSRAIVAAVVNLCHSLGLTAIAEGVETSAELDEVSALGCDAWQGFYMAGPMPTVDLALLEIGGYVGR